MKASATMCAALLLAAGLPARGQLAVPERHVAVSRPAGETARFGPANVDMAWIPAGGARLGCVEGDAECFDDERPPRAVTVPSGFWLATTELTVGAYRAYARSTGVRLPASPPFSQADSHPVVNITWEEAAAFCRWAGGRLPTEAEWEYAARGGVEGLRYPWGDAASHDAANYDGVQGGDRWARTAPVGSFPANAFGLHDVAGNVWEWTADVYPGGDLRVVRGGSFKHSARSMRLSNRGKFPPAGRIEFVGVRCLRDEEGGAAGAEVEPPVPSTPPSTPAAAPAPTVATVLAPTPGTVPAADGVKPGQRRAFPPSDAEMIWIPPGRFEMGAVRGDGAGFADEQPRHPVRISRGFWIDATEVTFARYARFAADAGRPALALPTWAEESHPVVKVSWEDAAAYCAWAGDRLPTEAEWEYAARGAAVGLKYPWGDAITHDDANFDGTGGRDQYARSSPVASFPPQGWGLFDMSGNAWEWTADFYEERYYVRSPEVDPKGPESGRARVVRGGSWTSDPGRLRSSYRFSLDPAEAQVALGFRCVRDPS